ncbi:MULTISPECIES: GNAT family N-acetyltransferase [unclassified Bradyrhizobium]|uniref:GNAT family N-acetyltransferase n=1 Tax=unclassified Bradyrhizobium TaxID=2631580 RepID=UPI00048CFCE2|nr:MULTISPECIES: GNAT family N-acetyltransferase [unclassified Bradyrhizobium]QIG91349.1 GNAT family N-acetyltransferase [Bradyrhizobium sp. 6(2017)]
MDEILYAREASIGIDEFIEVLRQSSLGERRPLADTDRMERMIANANLIVTARQEHTLIGVSRALTDFAYCCYLADLAVDRRHQGHGIGKRLIAETRRHAGPESMCLLLSAPDSIGFYKSIGMPQPDNAFLYKRER